MHNFGDKRWREGLVDDIRSQNEQNTRIVGDSTKSVRAVPIVQEMFNILADGPRMNDWTIHFNNLFSEKISDKIRSSLSQLKDDTSKWQRQRLQTRFFETGGMEFSREYKAWKQLIVDELFFDIMNADRQKNVLKGHIDLLWYEATCEVIRKGDVYNPSGRKYIPRVYFINSSTDKIGDAFRVKSDNSEKYEVIIPGSQKVLVRSVDGILSHINGDTIVHLESDLTRCPDGDAESKVAIATFPMSHYVNYRAVNVQKSPYWCTFAIGDARSSPHFMRYSGLTGAAVNSMLINNYLGASLDIRNVFSRKRVFDLSQETNWSNDEVVKRGTGANYGANGFLRPCFNFNLFVEFLFTKQGR